MSVILNVKSFWVTFSQPKVLVDVNIELQRTFLAFESYSKKIHFYFIFLKNFSAYKQGRVQIKGHSGKLSPATT